MPTRADEIRARHQVIRSDLDALEAKLKEGPAVEEQEEIGLRSEVLMEEFEKLQEELAPLADREQRLARVRSAMAQETQREDPPEERRGPDVIVRTKRDPFADMDNIRMGITPPGEVRARA